MHTVAAVVDRPVLHATQGFVLLKVGVSYCQSIVASTCSRIWHAVAKVTILIYRVVCGTAEFPRYANPIQACTVTGSLVAVRAPSRLVSRPQLVCVASMI